MTKLSVSSVSKSELNPAQLLIGPISNKAVRINNNELCAPLLFEWLSYLNHVLLKMNN